MKAGATPKLITSVSESNSFPTLEAPPINLAILPSKPSIIPATIIAITAISNLPSKANLIDVSPIQTPTKVKMFGNKTLGPLYPNGSAKGGEVSILGSANLITPAFFFDNNDKMRMSAFVDTGNIFEKTSNIDLGDIRMSAGLDLPI